MKGLHYSRVFATDMDEQMNSQIHYNITSGDDYLSVDEFGHINISKPLQSVMSFIIQVSLK